MADDDPLGRNLRTLVIVAYGLSVMTNTLVPKY